MSLAAPNRSEIIPCCGAFSPPLQSLIRGMPLDCKRPTNMLELSPAPDATVPEFDSPRARPHIKRCIERRTWMRSRIP